MAARIASNLFHQQNNLPMKQTTITALILVLAFSVNAQSTKVQYGLKAGLNVSGFTGTGAGTTHNLNSWYAGAQASLPFSKIFAFQPELMYSKEGFRSPGVKYIYEFVRMPLTFQLRHQTGVYAEFGAQVGVKIKATADAFIIDQKMEIPDMETINTGLIMGVGYRHPSGIGANFRYAPSISDIGEDLDGKLHTLSIGLSFTLESKK